MLVATLHSYPVNSLILHPHPSLLHNHHWMLPRHYLRRPYTARVMITHGIDLTSLAIFSLPTPFSPLYGGSIIPFSPHYCGPVFSWVGLPFSPSFFPNMAPVIGPFPLYLFLFPVWPRLLALFSYPIIYRISYDLSSGDCR
jgi:hypothetical protein